MTTPIKRTAKEPKLTKLDHAILSASSSALWTVCTPSAREQARYVDEKTDVSQEGTFMHTLAAVRLQIFLGDASRAAEHAVINSPEGERWYDAELSEHVNAYVRRCIIAISQARADDPFALVIVEERLPSSRWIPQGFGTSDLTIVAETYIHVRDLKGGKGKKVNVLGNKQLRIYALSALAKYGTPLTTKVIIDIDQPRRGGASSETIDVAELLKWADEELKPQAARAWKGEGEFVPGDHCAEFFCKARYYCRARARWAMATLLREPEGKDNQLSEEEIADILPELVSAAKWAKNLHDWASAKAVEKVVHWPGFKLVAGRGRRVIQDPDAVAFALQVEGVPREKLYTEPSLRPLGALEHLVGAETLAAIVPEGSITKNPGKPTLVPVTDSRPEWEGNRSAEDDFDDVEDDSD